MEKIREEERELQKIENFENEKSLLGQMKTIFYITLWGFCLILKNNGLNL